MQEPTTVKNSQANTILELVDQTLMGMLHTAEIDTAETLTKDDIADFLTIAAWSICPS